MWMSTHTAVSNAPVFALWLRLIDIPTWPEWNHGLVSSDLTGGFAVDSVIRGETVGGQTISSVILSVDPGRSFTDSTLVNGAEVQVRHEVEAAEIGSVVTFSVEVRGDLSDEISHELGRAVSSDLPLVLARLTAVADAP